MKVYTPEISWHERDPIYTSAFHPVKINKFVTAGVTGTIRLWEINDKNTSSTTGIGSNSDIEISFVANLKRHTKSVNVARWNHDGTVLASAGDEAVVFLWKENDIKNQKTLDNDDDESKENWFSHKCFRGHLEDILDISWSKDGTILISGSVDNSVIIWNVFSGSKLAILKEPKGFVQGVVYDPLGVTYACLSTDRSLRIFSVSNNKCIHNVNKLQMSKDKENTETTSVRMYHDDTMKSFFRRMCFSSDGSLLFTPAGCLDIDLKPVNVSFIYKKNSYSR